MKIEFPKEVTLIIERLNEQGFEAYAVGGCIRDSFLNTVPSDWDITTSARPNEIMEIFYDFKIIDHGIKHGTVGIIINRALFEVTTYRTDGKYSDNRRPDNVNFSNSLYDDLSRRDFTVNAIAYNKTDEIKDPFGGISDIQNKIIRSIGNPDLRFNEDGLRILRALRFSAALGFEIEENTAKSIIKNKELLNNISKERISAEFNKLIVGDNAYEVLKQFRDVIAVFIPEIVPTFDFNQRNPHHCFDVWEHSLVALKNVESDKALRLAMLFHDLGKPSNLRIDEDGIGHFKGHNITSARITRTILRRLKYDRKTIKEVRWLVEHHDDKLKTDRPSVKRYIGELGKELLIKLMKVQLADNSAKAESNSERSKAAKEILRLALEITANNECCRKSELKINGWDIRALGVPTGKQIGRIQKELFNLVLYDQCENNKKSLINAAKKIIQDDKSSV